MATGRVLVVDDEELNLFMIQEFLAEQALDIEVCADPQLAWERMLLPGNEYDLFVLDRMMPNLDGLELLRRIKRESRLAEVPVIIQTAASSPDQLREGLEAGAYYYLTKPYEPEALTSIVRAALEDHRNRQQLRSRVSQIEESRRLLRRVEYRFSTLHDVASLVPELASLCPVPDAVAPGLSDLMVNAVEHGNLGVTYKEKAQLKWDGNWEDEIRRRLALPEYAGRHATVCAERLDDGISMRFTIIDQGAGFDWQKFLDFDPDRVFDPNGRGIAMARMMSFDTLEYQGCGNTVVATIGLGL